MTFWLLAIAMFAVTKAFDVVDALVPEDWRWAFGYKSKTLLALVLSIPPALLFGKGMGEKLVLVFGIAGVAGTTHQIERFFARSADVQQQAVIMRGSSDVRRTGGW